MNNNFQDNNLNKFDDNLGQNGRFNSTGFNQNNSPELPTNQNLSQPQYSDQADHISGQPNFILQNNSTNNSQNPIQIEPNFHQSKLNANNYPQNIDQDQQLSYQQANHQSLHQDYNFQTNNRPPLHEVPVGIKPESPYLIKEISDSSQNNNQTSYQKGVETKNPASSTKQPHYVRLSTVIIIAIITLLISFLGTLLTSSAVSLIISTSSSQKSQSTQTVVQEVTNTKVTNEESGIIDVAKNSRDSVVSVIISRDLSKIEKTNPASKDTDLDPNQSVEIGAGSGFIVSSDGYIITNRHVVEEATDDYAVIFDNGETTKAQVLARDTLLDIAILKVSTSESLKPISLGSSEQLQVGQTVIAIGNSLGELTNTVSRGIISGLGRTIIASNSDGTGSETLDQIIQTDASINEGNSGGPLLDINGNVIGVNVAKSQDGENIGFSIPIDSVKFVLDSVKTTGKIERPYLGVQYTIITSDYANKNKLKVNYGALISDNENTPAISPNSPADKAGIKSGDIILEIDGQKINAQNDLKRIIQKKKVGDIIKLKIFRDDKNLELGAKLQANPQ